MEEQEPKGAKAEEGDEGEEAESAEVSDAELEIIEGEPKIDLPYYRGILEAQRQMPKIYTALAIRNGIEQRQKFVEGVVRNPEFSYKTRIDEEDCQRRLDYLDRLERDVEAETNLALRALYLAKIMEMRYQLLMQKAIGRDPEGFFEASEWLYGKPTEEAFNLAVEEYRAKKEAGKEAKEEGPTFKAEDIRLVFNRAIEELGIPRWEAVVDSRAASITVNVKHPQGPRVEIPPSREVGLAKLEELAGHEISTHIGRGRSGQLSKIALIGFMGADRYTSTEEGLATYAEQEIAERRGRAPKSAGLNGAIAVGAAVIEGRDFRETYEFLRSLGFTENGAWRSTRRVFRGLSDTSRKDGRVCTLDWTYRAGNIGVWQFIRTEGEAGLDRLWAGKVGPHHVGMLSELGATEAQLPRRILKIEDLLPPGLTP